MLALPRHSPVAHTAYHDLVRFLLDEKISEIVGTPNRVVRGSRVYWYDMYRIGQSVKKRYIGEETPQLLERLGHHNELKKQRDQRQKQRSRLIKILRGEGFISTDAATGSFLNALASAGMFRLGGTLIGTHAFRLYEGMLGIRYEFDDLAVTGDIDIASFEKLSLVLDDRVPRIFQKFLPISNSSRWPRSTRQRLGAGVRPAQIRLSNF